MTIFSNRMQNSPSQSLSSSHAAKGFTLVEIMITVGILTLVMASIIPTFLAFSKGMAALGNYSSMSMSSRNALEHFSRDIHMANRITTAEDDEVIVVLPSDAGGFVIHYEYDSTTKEFVRSKYESNGTTLLQENVLFRDVADFGLVYYNRLDDDISDEASILNEAKTIQLNAKLIKSVVNQNNTDYIISARFLMRNV